MRDRKETLSYVNRVRSAYGLDAVTELPAGTMRSAEDCVIARALNETGFSTLVYQDVIQVDDWEFANIIAAHSVERVRFVATSASRDVSNRDEYVAGVKSRLGVEPDVITGDEEAQLSFIGATSGLADGVASPYLVVDIGGGSTEFVFGHAQPEHAKSVNIGCVRMTERHLVADPATAESVAEAIADIDAAIAVAAQSVPITQAATVIGLAEIGRAHV